MTITKEELLDQLQRAFEMEEEMAATLIELADPRLLDPDIAKPVRDQVAVIFGQIKEDTLRHRETVQQIVAKVKEGGYGF